mmetsp:Transcript_22059/g.30321  ORF Transcript_22059/g.30321 Transcript_22059/m.30321 type:complete len:98 (+) Transcript_22059:82-375(+)
MSEPRSGYQLNTVSSLEARAPSESTQSIATDRTLRTRASLHAVLQSGVGTSTVASTYLCAQCNSPAQLRPSDMIICQYCQGRIFLKPRGTPTTYSTN